MRIRQEKPSGKDMDRAICEKEQKMKRFEKHSLEEILNLSPGDYTHPAVVDGKLVRCEKTKCTDCDLSYGNTRSDEPCTLHFIKWLYSEVQEDTSEGDPVNPPEKRGRRTRWIPITERLPRMYEKVIVTTSINIVTTAFMNDDQKWIYLEGRELCFDGTVTAWMPLPEPYKGESEDE